MPPTPRANLVRSSPWTNTYDPPIDDGVLPPPALRGMEETANEVFASYMANYYEGGASSVYCWELEGTSFAACVLFKKGAPSPPTLPARPPPSTRRRP